MICPICNSKTKKDNQDYCLNCAWEFEYFFDELSPEEHNKYIDKKKIYQYIYDEYSNNKEFEKLKLDFIQSQHKIQILEKENSALINDILELRENRRVIEDIEKDKNKEKEKKVLVKNKELHIGKEIVVLNNVMYHLKLPKILGKKSWNNVVDSIEKVNFHNHDDWRLPTKEELKNLFLEKEVMRIFFNNFNKENAFWTIEERNKKNAWEVQLKNQMINWGLKTNKNFVIYVRDIKDNK